MSALDALLRLLREGGLVMLPLVGVTFVLWYAVGYRAHLLRQHVLASARVVAQRVAARRAPALRRRLDDALAPLEDGLSRNASLARAVVLVAPLLGLLGTVSGMIELFDSLGTGTFQAQEGGIAGGIAQALLTTELGLAIAIPGFFASRVLERREANLRGQLEQLKSALVKQRAGGDA